MTLAIHHALRTSGRATQFIGSFQTAPRLNPSGFVLTSQTLGEFGYPQIMGDAIPEVGKVFVEHPVGQQGLSGRESLAKYRYPFCHRSRLGSLSKRLSNLETAIYSTL